MSKLIEKIKQNSRVVAQPIGFGREAVAPVKPRILLLAAINRPGEASPPELAAGADAALVSLSGSRSDAKTFKKYADSEAGIPWGGWQAGDKPLGGKQIAALGCDFIVFPADSPLGDMAVEQEADTKAGKKSAGAGKLLVLDETVDSSLLRTVADLPVDAVVVAGKDDFGPALTWRRLMVCRNYAGIISKPLLVTVPVKITAAELQALWEAGVSGVIVDAAAAKAAGVQGIREMIDNTDFPTQKKRDRVKAILPHFGIGVNAKKEEEPDEDEEDD